MSFGEIEPKDDDDEAEPVDDDETGVVVMSGQKSMTRDPATAITVVSSLLIGSLLDEDSKLRPTRLNKDKEDE